MPNRWSRSAWVAPGVLAFLFLAQLVEALAEAIPQRLFGLIRVARKADDFARRFVHDLDLAAHLQLDRGVNFRLLQHPAMAAMRTIAVEVPVLSRGACQARVVLT